MMVSDGFGPASQTYGRSYYQYLNNLPEGTLTPLDKILRGSSRTRSNDSLVTDSAAGATAFSCSLKTYNNAVGVDPTGIPCGTVLEAAKQIGMLTGIVVTSRVTDATPASFSAHVLHRTMEQDIALHQVGNYTLGRQVDLLMGGGSCYFLPNSTPDGCRTDGRNLLQEAVGEYGWKNVMLTRDDLVKLNDTADTGIPLPAMGLFRRLDLNFELDRDHTKEPSLSEMVEAALKALKGNAGSSQGFFLLIEGSRIDIAGHNNDPAAHVHEIMEYHRTVDVVRKFVSQNTDTLMISTSDHETGGFTLGFQPDPYTYPDYVWKPSVIEGAKASSDVLAQRLENFKTLEHDHKRRREFLKKEIFQKGLSITDPSEEEIESLLEPGLIHNFTMSLLGHALSRRAMLGWTTHGHTGVDVNLYADGDEDGYRELLGNHENTDIGEAMVKYLKLDLGIVTWRLTRQVNLGSWFKTKITGGPTHVEDYHIAKKN
ncbi:alkaline-phosphatase-like protein [Mortierella sp. GBAus27b]|nr:hypothetical protein BGX31_010481 [Mortierella sp. GBA43]KAI8355493.1 alkaline-phosphatase-like protein [Mortierella sp. GBAus27b]